MNPLVLVDCNNFFVSCERVFNPKLIGKPVVVLSSNDACVIARSQEAKALGIPMGIPAYKCKEIVKRHKVIVCSANFALYGDMSARVMQVLTELSASIEIYSIDEAFLVIPPYELHKDRFPFQATYAIQYMHYMRTIVKQRTGIPISIGRGPTKTLAKIANTIAKKTLEYHGVFDITNHPKLDQILAATDIGDVGGIGHRHAKRLKSKGIRTVATFITQPDAWVRSTMTIQGLKTLYELRGIPCLELEDIPADKQSITVSRSFGNNVTTFDELKEAVAHYSTMAAEKLRKQRMLTSYITVFVTTTSYQDAHRSYDSASYALPLATEYTPDLIKAAHQCLTALFKRGIIYKKAGVILQHFVPADSLQMSTFTPLPDLSDQHHLMKTVDSINKKWGKNRLFYAAAGIEQQWKMKQLQKSACFTTNWHEILTIKI